MIDEVFPAASYQYVLYGMGFPAPTAAPVLPRGTDDLTQALQQVEQRARTLSASLPTIRGYLDALSTRTAPSVMEQAI